jgi:hypothetical protein
MNTKNSSEQFKPSTYSSNVSTPLLERIKELEDEINLLKEQIKLLKRDQSVKLGLLPTPVNKKKMLKPSVLEQDQSQLIRSALY